MGKSQNTIAKRLVKPATLVFATQLLGEEAAYALHKIPLSNDTVKRQDEMAENLKQLVEKQKVSKFSQQIDETIKNSALLLCYVR